MLSETKHRSPTRHRGGLVQWSQPEPALTGFGLDVGEVLAHLSHVAQSYLINAIIS